MSKKIYVGVNNIAKNVNKMYVGVNNVAKKVLKGYVGVNGVAKEFFRYYTPLNYIESSGVERIDTGFKPNNNTSVEISMEIPSFRAGGNTRLFETRNATSGFSGSLGIFSLDDSNKQFQYRYNMRQIFNNQQLATETRYKISTDKEKIYINDTLLGSATISTFTCNYNLVIFALNDPNGINSSTADIYRLFYFKIYDNGTLIRDFIPVLDQEGTPCLYDKVENKFYYNSGTGTFIYN